MSIRALICDVDGTVLADDGTLPEGTREAVAKARDAGIGVYLATGRSPQACGGIYEELGLDTPVFAANGAAVYRPDTDDYLRCLVMDPGVASGIIAFAAAHAEVFILATTDERHTLCADTDHARGLAALVKPALETAPKDMPTEGVMKAVLVMPPGSGSPRQWRDRLVANAALDGNAYLTWYTVDAIPAFAAFDHPCVDVQPPCEGKAEAVRWLVEQEGLCHDEIAAVGDQLNDLPMLRAAGHAFAVANAAQEVLETADEVLPAAGDSGVAVLLRRLAHRGLED